MPTVEMYFGKGADLVVKEAKQPQHYTGVIIHEVPVENWMIDRLTLPELKVKLMAEEK